MPWRQHTETGVKPGAPRLKGQSSYQAPPLLPLLGKRGLEPGTRGFPVVLEGQVLLEDPGEKVRNSHGVGVSVELTPMTPAVSLGPGRQGQSTYHVAFGPGSSVTSRGPL